MTNIIMLFDMRAPEIGPPIETVYAEALEMARFADRVGFNYISISEHHGSDDNYLPAPFVMAAAVAGCTKRIRIVLNAVVLPLHHPIEVAEQIAVLDHVSQGRLEVIFGAGYLPSEFARFGVPMSQRGRLLDEGIETILAAYSGERFDAKGRDVFVRPLPRQSPHPPFIVGGGVERSAKRAARYGFGFAPMKPGLFDVYDAECRALNREPGPRWGLQGPIMVHVTEAPDTAWSQLMPHLQHVASMYAKWTDDDASSTYAGLTEPDAIRQSGKFAVVTPAQCIALAAEQDKLHSSIIFQPMIGGLAPELAWRSLTLFAEKVLPRLHTGTGT